ncbi:MAG: AI-2E family transporter [Gammaproteobacteria bacterium]|nr:AI-2E family transporter [Gammaproteobacteria bacterium]MDP6615917.1 AI-2E family transporter [Gammaproteobacteria bacterium]MDP6695044.1 AI-2E family transporter [Gammaproteobacteria bacterium]
MNLQNASFIGLLALVTLAFLGLLADFVQPIFWAATLAVLFHPAFIRILAVVKDRNSPAAFLTLLLICITVIIPTWFIASAVVTEATGLYDRIESGEINPAVWLDWLRSRLPAVNNLLDRAGITSEEVKANLSSAAVTGSRFIASLAITAGQNAVRFSVMFFLMLYVLYFFLRDGDFLLQQIIHALPLGDERERALFAKFAEVSRATVKGTLVIGIVQGALGGSVFWILGIEGAVFWGAVMVIMSLLPVVGASLVWGPAALFMLAGGAYIKAIVLVVFGVLVIGLVDNVLRPILVGRDTRMPDYLVLLSTLGGLTVFGASGFVIGPVIAALFLTLWVMFAKEFNEVDIGAKAESAFDPDATQVVSDDDEGEGFI